MIRLKKASLPTTGQVPRSIGRGTAKSSSDAKDGFTSLSTASGFGTMPTGMPGTNVGTTLVTVDLEPLLQGITPQIETKHFYTLYRDIYYTDPVCGSTVDLMSSLPFSDFNLGGIEDNRVESAYMEILERLNVRSLLPEISVDYLVLGAYCGSLLYNFESKIFSDIMSHAVEDMTIQSLPFYSQDPILTVKFNQAVKTLMQSDSPRMQRLRKKLGNAVIDKLQEDSLELDPISTIYLPRRTFAANNVGTSYFKRVLPIYLLEKNLFRGTLVESSRRQRGIMHITLGDGDQWEPTVNDMDYTTELFMNADLDPLGAIVATRTGISIEEVRAAGEFWKITDIWDSTMPFKMRALGVSESFLSGDANYQCVTGETLVPTDKGLLPIRAIGKGMDSKPQSVQMTVGSIQQPAPASKWLYSGTTDTYTITTQAGTYLCGTGHHPVLTIRNLEPTWVNLDSVKVGSDWACINPRQVVRTVPLKLNLSSTLTSIYNRNQEIKRPTKVTPELAYILGTVVSAGKWLDELPKVADMVIKADPLVMHRIVQNMRLLFGDYCFRLRTTTAVNDGHSAYVDIDFSSGQLTINNLMVKRWLKELGVADQSQEPTVPWAVLQADVESQLAYLAGCFDTHSSVSPTCIDLLSDTLTHARELLAILFSHGILCDLVGTTIHISAHDANEFLRRTETYRVLNAPITFSRDRLDYGIPTEWVVDQLTTKLEPDQVIAPLNLVNDQDPIFSPLFSEFYLSYDLYEQGAYTELMARLQEISEEMYNKLLYLFAVKYKFAKITSLAASGKQAVFDISMAKGYEPAFIANGMVVHNTSDTGLTVFVESLRSFRDMLTNKLFYNKLFPLISLIKGYTVTSKGKIVIRDNLMNDLKDDPEAMMYSLNDGSKLLRPTVEWSKHLKPEGDSAYMDILDKMAEKGVPIPLRVIAAAGGLNLNTLLKQEEEDLSLRTRINEYTKRIADLAPKPPAGEGEGGEEEAEASGSDKYLPLASTAFKKSSVLDKRGRIPLLAREFGEELSDVTKTGKKKVIFNQRSANSAINDKIIKAMKTVAKRGNTPLSNSTTSPFKKDN